MRDEGEGIPADMLPRVFQPLYSTRPEGTGLGLPVARRIVRAHGGTLTLHSEPGSGTTATVVFPRKEYREACPAPSGFGRSHPIHRNESGPPGPSRKASKAHNYRYD